MRHLNENQQFHDDAAEGRLAEVVQHIQRGIDINSRNPTGGTALMIAATRGHLHVVRALLEAGADPNVALRQVTYRALHTAAQEGHEQIVVELLEHGAEINTATQYGETALISAAYHGKTSMVKLLLSRGANPNKTDLEGNTALDWARRRGHSSTARVLEGTETKQERAETKSRLLSRLLSFLN